MAATLLMRMSITLQPTWVSCSCPFSVIPPLCIARKHSISVTLLLKRPGLSADILSCFEGSQLLSAHDLCVSMSIVRCACYLLNLRQRHGCSADKMRRGIPLTDDDRWPWLHELASIIDSRLADTKRLVMGCSALKEAYRDILRGRHPDAYCL